MGRRPCPPSQPTSNAVPSPANMSATSLRSLKPTHGPRLAPSVWQTHAEVTREVIAILKGDVRRPVLTPNNPTRPMTCRAERRRPRALNHTRGTIPNGRSVDDQCVGRPSPRPGRLAPRAHQTCAADADSAPIAPATPCPRRQTRLTADAEISNSEKPSPRAARACPPGTYSGITGGRGEVLFVIRSVVGITDPAAESARHFRGSKIPCYCFAVPVSFTLQEGATVSNAES